MLKTIDEIIKKPRLRGDSSGLQWTPEQIKRCRGRLGYVNEQQ